MGAVSALCNLTCEEFSKMTVSERRFPAFLLLKYLNFQIIKFNFFNKIILAEPCFIVAFEVCNILESSQMGLLKSN